MAVWHSHVGIVVGDMDKALPYWTKVLGFEPVRHFHLLKDDGMAASAASSSPAHAKVHWLRHGDCQIELLGYVNWKHPIVKMGPRDVHASHQGFYAESMEKHYERLKAQGTWFLATPEGASTIHAKDPDGNWLQLVRTSITANIPRSQLPLDKAGFGHAHSALAVNNMQDAVSFYRDLMGMELVKWQVVEPSRFIGTVLEGVRLQEVWLRVGNFMVELIEYGNKQDIKLDMDVMDVHATHIAFFCDSVQQEHARLKSKGIWFRDDPYDAQGNPRPWVWGKDCDGNWFELTALPADGHGALPKP